MKKFIWTDIEAQLLRKKYEFTISNDFRKRIFRYFQNFIILVVKFIFIAIRIFEIIVQFKITHKNSNSCIEYVND